MNWDEQDTDLAASAGLPDPVVKVTGVFSGGMESWRPTYPYELTRDHRVELDEDNDDLLPLQEHADWLAGMVKVVKREETDEELAERTAVWQRHVDALEQSKPLSTDEGLEMWLGTREALENRKPGYEKSDWIFIPWPWDKKDGPRRRIITDHQGDVDDPKATWELVNALDRTLAELVVARKRITAVMDAWGMKDDDDDF